MGLFDFLRKKEDKKVDIDGQEIVTYEEPTPVPVEHSNVMLEGHDVFSKAMEEVGEAVVVEDDEKVEDIIPIIEGNKEIDLTSINGSHEEDTPAPIDTPVPAEPAPAPEPIEEPKEEVPTEEAKEETPVVDIKPNDMAIFKECLLAEVKRKKGTRELETEEDVRKFCQERMLGFTQGTFQYPEDVRKSMKKYIENQDVIRELNGQPRILQPEEESVKKVA